MRSHQDANSLRGFHAAFFFAVGRSVAIVSRNVARSPRRRRGLSLLELILVLGVMIMIAALSVPLLQRSFTAQKLDKGADRVRAEMGKARVRAIRTGDLHAFFYMPGGSQFKVVPFFEGAAQIMDDGSSQIDNVRRAGNFDFHRDLLPQGIRFATAEANVDARAAEALRSGPSSHLQPILFYADGTSQDAKIILQNEQGDSVQVQLRGLTGTTAVTKDISN